MFYVPKFIKDDKRCNARRRIGRGKPCHFCVAHLLPAVEVRPIVYRICWRDDGTRCVCTVVHFYHDGSRAIDI